MMSQLVFLSLLIFCYGVVHHVVAEYHGEGHDDNCVDNSHFSGIEYNVTTRTVCRHKVENVCQKKKEEVCIPVMKMTCGLVAYNDCSTKPLASTQRCDKVEENTFVSKECKPDKVVVLEEVKKIPVCTTVTKQQCDSRWKVTEEGLKVWDGKENCRNVSWEDCLLEEKIMKEDIATYSCVESDILPYPSLLVKTEDIESYERLCQVTGNTVCTYQENTQCTIVE